MTQGDPSEHVLKALGERFAELFDLYERAGRRLYLVGGCVRDRLLGEVERTDFDFATDALPEESLVLLKAAGLRTFPIGARFGTVAALVDGIAVEITTFRVKEQYEEGNRKPVVEFGESLEDDLSRRDLSINAMAMDREGRLIDPFGGREALEAGVLEVPRGGLENTCSILRDDPLRLLRIARFAGRLGFRPTEETTAAAERCREGLRSISHERWKMEMDKLLVTRHVRTGLAWLARTGGLEVIVPEAAGLVACGQVDRVGAQLAGAEPDVRVRWAVLVLHAVVTAGTGRRLDVRDGAAAWPPAEERVGVAASIAARFRFSNDERATLCRLVGTTVGPLELDAVSGRPELRRLAVRFLEDTDRALALMEALADTVADGAERVDRVRRALWALRQTEDPVPRLPKGVGHALLEAFDIERGPILALVMGRLREAVIEEGLPNPPTAEACVAYLRAHPEMLAEERPEA